MADRKINIRVSTTGAREVSNLAGLFSSLVSVVPLVAVALTALTVAAVKAAKEFVKFESKLADIKTLATDTSDTLDDFKEQLLGIKKATPLAELNDLTAAMYKYISATGDTEGAEKALTNISKAAIGNQADVASTTDMLARVMKNFGKTAADSEDIMNKFSATVTNANATGEDFATVAGDMSAAADFAGLSMEEMMATFAAGSQTLDPRKVAFGFQSLTTNIIDNRNEFAKWGVSTNSLNETLADLVRLQGEMSQPEYQDMIRKLVPDRRGMKLMNALVANYDGFKQSLDEINNSEGLMAEKFAVKMDTAEAKFEAIEAAIEDFTLRAGELFTEVGEAFIGAFDEDDVDVILTNILSLIESLVPLLKQIAELLGTGVSNSVKTISEDLATIAELIRWINSLFGDSSDQLDGVGKKSIDLGNLLHVVLEILKLIPTYINNIKEAFKGNISIVQALSSNLNVMVETLRVAFGLAEKTTAEMEKQSRMQGRALKQYEDKVNRYKDWGESGLLLSQLERGMIDEEELAKAPPGAVDYAIGKGWITQEQIDRVHGKTPESPGGGLTPTTEDGTDELIQKSLDGLDEYERRRRQYEEERKAAEEERIKRRRDAENESEEAKKKEEKRTAKSISDTLVDAVRSGKVLSVLRDVFLNKLWSFVAEALAKAIVMSGILGVLNILSGGVSGGVQKAFGAEGLLSYGKILKLAHGDTFGKGTHVMKRPTLMMGGEGPSNELLSFIPLDHNGVRIVANDIIPTLEQATGFKFGGSGSNVTIHIDPIASQLVDTRIAQSATRGNRILSNDVGE